MSDLDLESSVQIPLLGESSLPKKKKPSRLNWDLVILIIAMMAIMCTIFMAGYNIGHLRGYWDGYNAGYMVRNSELPPSLPCHGKPNCESVD